MKRANIINFLLGCMVGVALLASCSEEELTPSGADDNAFAVAEDDHSETAQIRRNFYEDHSIHLLFSDVLRKEYLGKDHNGNDLWKEERLDLDYNLTADASKGNMLEFLETPEQQRDAVKLVEKYILPHLAKGGQMSPYSILLVSSMQQDDYGDLIDVPVFTNMRCLAIAVGEWIGMTEEKQEEQGKEILFTLLSSKLDVKSDALQPFLAYCEDMHYEYLVDYIPDWDREHIEDVYAFGMLGYTSSWRGSSRDYFYSEQDDAASYLEAIMNSSEEEFMDEYGEYAVIVARYNAMKEAIVNLGYKF